MMRPYWEAQDAGGQLVIIRAASGPLPLADSNKVRDNYMA
eukprot:SAG11_NODE_4599_length_1840_cov_1.008616_2_plen_40_part_00